MATASHALAQAPWKVLSKVILLLILTAVCWPTSGLHQGIPWRALPLLGTLGLTLWGLARTPSLPAAIWKSVLIVALVGSLVLLLACWGAMLGTAWEWALDQAKVMWVTALMVWLLYVVVEMGWMSTSSLARGFVGGSCLYAGLKCALVVAMAMRILPIHILLAQTEIQLVTCTIVDGLPRIQTSCDLAAPLALYLLLSFRSWFPSRWGRGALGTMLLLSLFFSFSRSLLFMGVSACMLSALHQGLRAAARRLGGVVVLFLLLQALFSRAETETLVRQRFSGEGALRSDLIRQQQASVLWQAWSEVPWWGGGLGAHSSRMIRSQRLPYSYELQWVALLWQSGWIVWGCWQLALLGLLWPLVQSRPRTTWGILILAAGYWLAGWTNPYVTSLLSGLIYGIFHLTAAGCPDSFPPEKASLSRDRVASCSS